MVKAFSCPCGVTWYKCPRHQEVSNQGSGEGAGERTKKEKETAKGKSRIRKDRGSEDLEGLLTERRRKKTKASEPSFRPSMLSAGLKRKFAHLCQDDTEL